MRRRRGLKPVSDKRRALLDGPYAAALEEVKQRSGGRCELQTPVCVRVGHEPHHLRGRVGADLYDPELIVLACRPCHDHAENHRTEGYANGWLLRRNRRRT